MTLERMFPQHVPAWGEELANSISHGIGFLLAVASTPFLILTFWPRGPLEVMGVSVFAITMMLLYLASTLYHAFPVSKTKQLFHMLDHAAIFLLIAGTYTPFTLGVLRGTWGWAIFTLIWLMALSGIIMTVVSRVGYPRLVVFLYLGMGWLIVIAIWPLWLAMPTAGLAWLVAGGVAYTVGVGFYAATRMPYSHFIWHLFVLAGTTCHFMAVLQSS